jgi:hypothetical protein
MPSFLKLTTTKDEKVNINFDKVLCFKELIHEPAIGKKNNIMKFTKIEFTGDELICVNESEDEINFLLEKFQNKES